MKQKYRIFKDGFVWLTLSKTEARDIFDYTLLELHALHDDDTRSPIESIWDLKGLEDGQVGIGIGFLSELEAEFWDNLNGEEQTS